jgi:hypothetical protein
MSRRRNGPNRLDTILLRNARSQFATILRLVQILLHSDPNQPHSALSRRHSALSRRRSDLSQRRSDLSRRRSDLSRRRNDPIRHRTEQNRRDLNVIDRQGLKLNR